MRTIKTWQGLLVSGGFSAFAMIFASTSCSSGDGTTSSSTSASSSGESSTSSSGGGSTSSSTSASSSGAAAMYNVGGAITGLTRSGLVLQNNGGDNLSVNSGSTAFSFATKVSGAYAVTVATQPSQQTCMVTNGTGTATADVTNVAVSCAINTATISGTVTQLQGMGLVLQVVADTGSGADAGADSGAGSDAGTTVLAQTTVNAAGGFSFPALPVGTAYRVVVATQPASQTCAVTAGGSGVLTANASNVTVYCPVSATFNSTGGVQTFTVPAGVTSVTVDAFGAEGGTSTGEAGGLNIAGGKGARAAGTFAVTPGDVLTLIVGGRGANYMCGAAGGGGTWVSKGTTLLLVAGGGGGGFNCNVLGSATGGGGQTANDGQAGQCTAMRTSLAGGTAGNGGASNYGGGGGGYLSAGTCNVSAQAAGPRYTATAPLPTATNGGGVGGGGGYVTGCCNGGGGGGGYSGGGGSQFDGCGGGGGGSYNTGTMQTMTANTRTGAGTVTITY